MKKISKIVIEHLPDYDADLSYLGTFDNEAKDKYAIEHDPQNPSVFHWFNPQPGTVETKKQAQQVYDRMMAYENGNWSMLGIKAVAKIKTSQDGNIWKLDEITSSGLWGIESDQDAADYKEVEDEQVYELKDTLKEFGFTDAEIAAVPVEHIA